MTPAFSQTRHVTDFSTPCGIPAHACLCVALFICHPPYPILSSQWRPPRETQNLASPVLSITPARTRHPYPSIAVFPSWDARFSVSTFVWARCLLASPPQSYSASGVMMWLVGCLCLHQRRLQPFLYRLFPYAIMFLTLCA